MNKVLIYGNRKQNPILWDISTKEKESIAFLALFNYLNREWEVYTELREPPAWDASETKEQRLYKAALTGDAEAARELLTKRKDCEYESWTTEHVLDSLDAQTWDWRK